MSAEPVGEGSARKPSIPRPTNSDRTIGPTKSKETTNSESVDEEDDEDEDEDDDDDDDEEEEEPKLKYARMTGNLKPVYRNGDASSTFMVAGDKMFIGTHNGNIHVVSLPSFQSIRVYTAHTASVTSLSISPFPPSSNIPKHENVQKVAAQSFVAAQRSPSTASVAPASPRSAKTQIIPNTPSNSIYIATSSMDGNVCVASLIDIKDVQLRNFARPVQAVALSPDYKNDRTYISGGLAGHLVLTLGGRAGTSSTSSTTGTASATASGWLGSIGLGGNTGKDTVLHYGEGTVSTIKWSLSGKYVAWANEHGIWIMRSHLHLDAADSENAWKRFGHVERPSGDVWDEMAGVWKARIEWIDEKSLESDEHDKVSDSFISSPAAARLKSQASKNTERVEKLLVGWGSTVWIINVHPGGTGIGKNAGERSVGKAEIIEKMLLDCIVCGLSLYTPSLLIALCYSAPGKDDEEGESVLPAKGHKSKPSTASTSSEPRGGIRRRQNAPPPELRLIDWASREEIEVDTDDLKVSRYERLSASDYHLGVLPAIRGHTVTPTPRGTLEALSGMGSGVWNATLNATSLLSSAASVRSGGSKSDGDSSTKVPSAVSSSKTLVTGRETPAHPIAGVMNMKIFVHSPYDCIIATKRDLSDHLTWILERHQYERAWNLIDENPEVISTSAEKLAEIGPGTIESQQSDDFYDDVTSIADSASRAINSSVEKEKRRIGDLWIKQLVDAADWITAGQICGKVLGTSTRWEHWVWVFVRAKKFDEITPYIPTSHITPPLPSTIYEVILGHYITNDRPRAWELLEQWPPELFEIKSITTVLENQLKFRDVREDSVEDGEKGRDWRIVTQSLGKLYVADGRPREALKCYIRLQDADAAMSLIRDFHLVDAISDDISSFILLRVSKEQTRSASIAELEDLTSEAMMLLVTEARQGLVRPDVVISQLQRKNLALYTFFYLRSLWRGDGIEDESAQTRENLVQESRSIVDEFADLAVDLFANYDRPLLMEFLKMSTFYTFEKASQICEEQDYIPELVYLYSKTGQTKRALYLIIDRLGNVSQAIEFAKEQDDKDLWEDLLDYSMDKPRFIRGLLEEVGTAIDPITLVRRIPEGLEIEGLRHGLSRMIKEHELQYSISSGVARVLRGEVAAKQNALRTGQRKGVKFDVVHKSNAHVDVAPSNVMPTTESVVPLDTTPAAQAEARGYPPGHCAGCHKPFAEDDMETLVGFACGHAFHLSHLLAFLHPNDPPTPPDVELDEDGEFAMTHSIGAKVSHARLLKDQISGGCPVCLPDDSMTS